MAINKKSRVFPKSSWNLMKMIASWANLFHQVSSRLDKNCWFFTNGQFLNVSCFFFIRLYLHQYFNLHDYSSFWQTASGIHHTSVFYHFHTSNVQTIASLGAKIFKNPFFMTYMYNMRIKWKLKIHQIQIRNRSCNLKEIFGWKMNFKKFVLISTRFFSKSKFFKVFQIQSPKIFLYLFQTPKKLDPGRPGQVIW